MGLEKLDFLLHFTQIFGKTKFQENGEKLRDHVFQQQLNFYFSIPKLGEFRDFI